MLLSRQNKFVLLIAIGLSLCACTTKESDDGAKFYLALTDAPVDDAQNVVIQFAAVELVTASGEVIYVEFDPPKQIDLLSLQGSMSSYLLEGLVLAPQNLSEIRLHVDADDASQSYVKIGQYTQPITLSAQAESALTLPVNVALEAGGATSLTVDFDLRRSLTTQDNNQTFQLNPVLRVVDNAHAGHIGGYVPSSYKALYNCTGNGDIYVYEGHDAVTTDMAPGTGPINTAKVTYREGSTYYETGFLPLGDYTLAFTCDAGIDHPSTSDAVSFPVTQNVTISQANLVATSSFK